MKKFLTLLCLALISGLVFAQNAEGSLVYGESVEGELSDNVTEQFWLFEGEEGDVVTISMTAEDESELDTWVWLYDPNEIPLIDNDDIEAGENLNSEISDFELPEDGEYIIRATRISGEGAYSLSLKLSGAGQIIRQWASSAEATSSFGTDSWSAAQATGEPNTEQCGDYTTAWASASSTGQDSLTVYFDIPVIPTQINVYQTYNPGSIIGIDVTTVDGEVIEVTNSADPLGNTECPGVFSLDIIGADVQIDTVTIHLDQSIGGSWNEIDAVELVGSTSPMLSQWASVAEATSQYGEDSWSASQATGEPDTATCGDQTSAWASATSTGEDSIALGYEIAVIPSQINIYQTYTPGSIVSVSVVTVDGDEIVLEDSADPVGNTECPGVFSINIEGIDEAVDIVIIYLDQSIGGSWNEIDAVELVGTPAE